MSAPENPAEEQEPAIAPIVPVEPEHQIEPDVKAAAPAIELEEPPAVADDPEAPEPEPVSERSLEPVAEAEATVEAKASDATSEPVVEAVVEGVPAADEAAIDGPGEIEAIPSFDEAELAFIVRSAVVDEAEKLRDSNEFTKTSNAFRDLLEKWRKAGSSGRERDDELWTRFSTARDAFYERRNAHHAERARSSVEAGAKKRALIATSEELLETSDPRKIGDGLDRMLEEWKAAGRAGSEDQTLWVQFRAVRDRAFTLRRELVAARGRARDESKAAKEAMIAAAQAAPRDLDVDALQALLDEQMAAWKQIPSAGRDADEALWQRFREARGAGFSRLRGIQQRKERERDRSSASVGGTVEHAQRLAFSDAPVTDDDVARLEKAFARGADTASAEVRGGFDEAIGRLRERATKAATAVPSGNPISAARTKMEQTIRDLESRVEAARSAGNKRDLARAEKRLAEERERLERMAALLGSR